MLLLLACSPPPFTCENAAKALDRPEAKVVACEALPTLPEVYQVALEENGARTALAVVVKDGRPVADHGHLALVTFLQALPAERRAALTMRDVNGLLRAFDAFPPHFGPRDWNFDLPDVGRSSFRAAPFELVLYAAEPPPPERAADLPVFRRGTLAEPGYAWRIERFQAGAWGPDTP